MHDYIYKTRPTSVTWLGIILPRMKQEDLIDRFEIRLLGNGYSDMSFRVKDKSLTRSELVSGESIKKYTAVTKIYTIISKSE